MELGFFLGGRGVEEWSGKRGVGVGEWRRGLQYEIMVQSSMVRTDPYPIFSYIQ